MEFGGVLKINVLRLEADQEKVQCCRILTHALPPPPNSNINNRFLTDTYNDDDDGDDHDHRYDDDDDGEFPAIS